MMPEEAYGRKQHKKEIKQKNGEKIMKEYIKEIEQVAAKCTLAQSDGYSQIMRICDAMREQQDTSEKATEVVELFEELLDRKGIEIPCDDEDEQKERYDGNNTAKLYGMEYYNLVSGIQNLL